MNATITHQLAQPQRRRHTPVSTLHDKAIDNGHLSLGCTDQLNEADLIQEAEEIAKEILKRDHAAESSRKAKLAASIEKIKEASLRIDRRGLGALFLWTERYLRIFEASTRTPWAYEQMSAELNPAREAVEKWEAVKSTPSLVHGVRGD